MFFEQASRLKLRFETPRGNLSVEDLWDLSLAELDKVAVSLYQQMQTDNISFVKPDGTTDPKLNLRFDVARHIIDVRLDEKRKADEAHATAEKKQKILGIIARKEEAELEGHSLDELRQLIANL